jgi:predicted  nucleic acid-binding Zn-ribbon protein
MIEIIVSTCIIIGVSITKQIMNLPEIKKLKRKFIEMNDKASHNEIEMVALKKSIQNLNEQILKNTEKLNKLSVSLSPS